MISSKYLPRKHTPFTRLTKFLAIISQKIVNVEECHFVGWTVMTFCRQIYKIKFYLKIRRN
jgi:hypothetical protein